jgi:hypothetical protein
MGVFLPFACSKALRSQPRISQSSNVTHPHGSSEPPHTNNRERGDTGRYFLPERPVALMFQIETFSPEELASLSLSEYVH